MIEEDGTHDDFGPALLVSELETFPGQKPAGDMPDPPTPDELPDVLVRTDRLSLRRWRESDADAFFAVYGRDDVTRWLGPKPRRALTSPREAVERIRLWRDREAGLSKPLGLWAIVDRPPDGAPIGTVLLMPLPAADGPTSHVEVGWHLHPDLQGRGLATEAARAVLAAAARAGIGQVLALTDLDNERSQALAVRVGMIDDGPTDRWFGLTTRQYRMTLTSGP